VANVIDGYEWNGCRTISRHETILVPKTKGSPLFQYSGKLYQVASIDRIRVGPRCDCIALATCRPSSVDPIALFARL
jgi:hypothetical protein